jgi:hypothetical protein
MKGIPYPFGIVHLSARILDIEHESNSPILDVNKGIEPGEHGHRRAGCSRLAE